MKKKHKISRTEILYDCSVSGMSALYKNKNHQKIQEKSLQVLHQIVCAVSFAEGLLGDSNRLNDLEYRRAAHHKQKESEEPWSHAELFFAAFLKNTKKNFN